MISLQPSPCCSLLGWLRQHFTASTDKHGCFMQRIFTTFLLLVHSQGKTETVHSFKTFYCMKLLWCVSSCWKKISISWALKSFTCLFYRFSCAFYTSRRKRQDYKTLRLKRDKTELFFSSTPTRKELFKHLSKSSQKPFILRNLIIYACSFRLFFILLQTLFCGNKIINKNKF